MTGSRFVQAGVAVVLLMATGASAQIEQLPAEGYAGESEKTMDLLPPSGAPDDVMQIWVVGDGVYRIPRDRGPIEYIPSTNPPKDTEPPGGER